MLTLHVHVLRLKLEHRDSSHCVTWLAEKLHIAQLLLHPAKHHQHYYATHLEDSSVWLAMKFAGASLLQYIYGTCRRQCIVSQHNVIVYAMW